MSRLHCKQQCPSRYIRVHNVTAGVHEMTNRGYCLAQDFIKRRGCLREEVVEVRTEVGRIPSRQQDLLHLKQESATRFQENTLRLEKLESGTVPPTVMSVDDISDEMQNRVSRLNNLIMYKVEEIDANGARTNDLTQVQNRLRNVADITIQGIKVRRIGQVKDGKPRPILIEMRSHHDVIRVMGSRKSLPNGILVASDKTKAQRAHLSSLYAEVSRINEEKGSRVKAVRYVNSKPCIVDLVPAVDNLLSGAGHPPDAASKND
ncbi:hypothetical protein QAD02_021046 [Eretmocerus hayati]|uniref:Uncharacterized protein n=1 Tax=Eretmocerus hayati TaxID=131215 RepID=A0ACC2PP61_9HYME|nr:hypothetical protein QAD02_021046 [Eretmocerus hayati]